MTTHTRCPWCGTDPLYVHYHDTVWGRPEYDDQALFEKLCLDGQQAGLSWITILRKHDSYRAAYDHFDPEAIARYDDAKVAQLLANPGIVRNRLKVQSIIRNARAYLALRERGEGFADFLWSFVDGWPVQNQWRTLAEVARHMNCSREYCRQVVQRALRKLRKTGIQSGLVESTL